MENQLSQQQYSQQAQYQSPAPMRIIKTQKDKVARLIEILRTSEKPNYDTFDRLDGKIRFIRERVLPIGQIPIATCCNKKCTYTAEFLDIVCSSCDHEVCPYCFCRTIPAPGWPEYEKELAAMNRVGPEICEVLKCRPVIPGMTEGEYTSFRWLIKSQPAWRRIPAACCDCGLRHRWAFCPRCNHQVCSMYFHGAKDVDLPSYERWLKGKGPSCCC